ncbi:hypothetical protein V6N11_051458 [Hibiscus sabdariffa]|uniref:Uncharacterized protein n=1 Tax=Hibiscus sabdariffa TaxID=183260 RepID=A0ABR2U7G9_9ROSI
MSSNTPSFTMNGENECEGQLGAGDQDNGGRQENVTTDVGGINDGIQPGATDVGPEVSRVSPEIPRAESGVEAAVEQDVRSDDESICDDRQVQEHIKLTFSLGLITRAKTKILKGRFYSTIQEVVTKGSQAFPKNKEFQDKTQSSSFKNLVTQAYIEDSHAQSIQEES